MDVDREMFFVVLNVEASMEMGGFHLVVPE